MKIRALLLSSMLLSLTACAGLIARPVEPDNTKSEATQVDWDKIVSDVEDILKPRPVKGPIQNRGEAETGLDLWNLSLQQELAHQGSEGDKERALVYVRTVAEKAKEQSRLAKCKRGLFGWACRRKAVKRDP